MTNPSFRCDRRQGCQRPTTWVSESSWHIGCVPILPQAFKLRTEDPMPKIKFFLLVFLTVLIPPAVVFADMVVFDFDHVQTLRRKGATASDIEVYMEGLFGSDISVNKNVTAIKSSLRMGKGKGPSGITIDFGANPIHSFSVDFQLFKKAKSFAILADGTVVHQQTLSKAQRKTGLSGHQDSYFFDTPVQKLTFVGLKKKSFAIDNLILNIPLPTDDELTEDQSEEGESGTETNGAETGPSDGGQPTYVSLESVITSQAVAAVPEPSSLAILIMGLCCTWFSRRVWAR